MIDETTRAAVGAAIKAGVLPPAPDGPIVPRFDALELAQALEAEINRAGAAGHTKIRIDMDLTDATEFARQLRRMTLMGL